MGWTGKTTTLHQSAGKEKINGQQKYIYNKNLQYLILFVHATTLYKLYDLRLNLYLQRNYKYCFFIHNVAFLSYTGCRLNK